MEISRDWEGNVVGQRDLSVGRDGTVPAQEEVTD